MTTPKPLPLRPSLDSLRKQAKKLARDVAAANAAAIARVRAQLPDARGQLTRRDAQLVIAREYGFAGWRDLNEEVLKRTGRALAWAAAEAQRAIHDNDTGRLRELLAEHPLLASWRGESGETLLHATTAFAMDVRDAAREAQFYRPACAEILIDSGAVVEPSWWERVIGTGGAEMLRLLRNKSALPRTLPVLAALGDLDAVRGCLDDAGLLPGAAKSPGVDDLATVNEAFMNACRFKHRAIASLLLDRSIALDGDLGRQIDNWHGRTAFVEYLCEHNPPALPPTTPWRAFVTRLLADAIDADDPAAFARWTRGQSWLLEHSGLSFQVWLLEWSTVKGRARLIRQLLELEPAILSCRAPPGSDAVVFAFEYGHSDVIPLLRRIWPIPDDLPHAAGMGDLERVKRWFGDGGEPALGDPRDHYPLNHPGARRNLHWEGSGEVQPVLDVALAWACVNRRFEVAEFLLGHGADINTRWSTHEPASILHECVLRKSYEAARFLIDHGIDLTIRDYRWNATAAGWAYNAAHDEQMYRILSEAEARRNTGRS